VTGIPTLVIVDGSSGATISTEGRRLVMTNPDGFPWKWTLQQLLCISSNKCLHIFAFGVLDLMIVRSDE